ncbi:MAG: response regulator transcription factor [Blastocatellia bacterium]|nr:response regulator transcription factor [Blastocatellia bacterium]
MSEQRRILVVDDEPQITRVLRRSLMSHGYNVRIANDAESALDTMAEWLPDLVITDLSMPEMDGLELTRRIRRLHALPVIVLSVKGEELTKVRALDEGADDYITKPFGIDELLARIRAALRRAPAAENAAAETLDAGDFHVHLPARQVRVRGQDVHLTPKEYDLLLHLLRNPGKVMTHRALLGAVWGGDYTEQNEYLRVFIGQLRKKIELDPTQPRHILTEPWVGYRFNPGP